MWKRDAGVVYVKIEGGGGVKSGLVGWGVLVLGSIGHISRISM